MRRDAWKTLPEERGSWAGSQVGWRRLRKGRKHGGTGLLSSPARPSSSNPPAAAAPTAGTSPTRLRSSWRGERRAFAWVDILAGVLAVPTVAERFPLFSPC